MPSIKIDYIPHEKQAAFHQSGARFKLLRAGRRSGKTVAAAVELIRWAIEKPGHYWIVAPTFVLMRVAERTFRKYLPKLVFEPGRRIGRHYKTEKMYELANGSIIEMRSADNADSLVAEGLDGVWVDEAARVSRSAWEENLRACLADRQGRAIFSTTPKGQNSWIYDLHKNYPVIYGTDFAEFVFRTIDNTKVKGLAREVELARLELPARYFKQDFEGSFEAFTGLCWPEFSKELHVMKSVSMPDIGAMHRLIAGVDWGYTHPACILVGGVCGEHIYVIDEFYKDHVIVDESGLIGEARLMAEKYGIELFVADPSEPGYIKQFCNAGLWTRNANNDVGPGIQEVAKVLMPRPGIGPRCYISERCVNLIDEIQGYHFGEGSEKPVKEKDEACDSLRYLVAEATGMGGYQGESYSINEGTEWELEHLAREEESLSINTLPSQRMRFWGGSMASRRN